jgi:isoleucyl-tRNA synthetase
MDTAIERKMSAMQRVIKLARTARERRSISLKTPLKSLVVIGDPLFISDIDTLRSYITEELNVNEVILTTNEEKYNIRLEARVDWPSLGKRLKRDVQIVRKALPNLTQEELRQYQREKRIVVSGIQLAENDLSVVRVMPTDNAGAMAEGGPSWEPSFDDCVVVLLDGASYPELEHDGLARDLITRFQKLRKKAQLVPLDDVKMQYSIVSNPEGVNVDSLISSRQTLFSNALRGQIEELAACGQEGALIEEDQSLGALTLRLRLSHI